MQAKKIAAKRRRKGPAGAAAAFGLLAFAPGAGALDSSPAQATAAAQSYEIPAGPVAIALNRLADKSGAELIYDTNLTRNKRTHGLKGRHTLADALGRVLSGTGLTYRLSPDGAEVAIMLAQNDTGTQTDAGAIALPTVEVEPGQRGAGCGPYGGAPCSGFGGAGLAQDPFNPSYVLPDASVGTKTDTPVMDTPLNVQSVTQQVLRDQQVTTLGEALENVSGITVSSSITGNERRANGITIRGFDTFTFYRDGFRIDSVGQDSDFVGSRQLANVASVEVLKGPGAILYGLVEPGGIVNIVTKEPLNVPYFAVQQQIGSLALYRTTVDATGPVTDDKSVLYRMNMSYENNGAPFGSIIDLTHSQNIFLAPVIKWNIDGANWVKLEAEYNDDRSNLFYALDPLFNGAFVTIPRSRNYSESISDPQKTIFAALTWSHQFDNDWSIKQQIAYSHDIETYNLTRPFDFIVSNLVNTVNGPAIHRQNQSPNVEGQTTYSTNVDITGHIDTFGASHTLLLGGDVYRTIGDFSESYFPNTSTLIDLLNPIHPGIPDGGDPALPPFTNVFTQNTAGLYAQDQIKLPYNFFLLAGARYQYIRQTSASGQTFESLTPDGRPLVGQALTPRYGLLWRPQEWVSLYGDYTEGFGANTSFLIFPGMLAPPSNARSWETGVKLEFFGGKLRATADYYDLTKTNIPTADPLHPGFSLLIGEARSKGPELDIQGEILPGWSVIAAYTNQDVRVTNGTGFFGTIQPGQRFPAVARNLASLWTTYEFQDETLKGWKIGGGYIYHGSQPFSFFGGPGTFPLLPSYGTVNLMAAYSFKLADAKMTAQLNVTNLFDRTYYTDASTSFPVAPGFQGEGFRKYGAPFAVLGSLRAEFSPAGQAIAAEPAPPPVFTWTGLYLGGQIGYAWGVSTGTVAFATPGGISATSALVGSGNPQGVIGGARAGYNLQINQWVIGVEGTGDGTTLSRTELVAFTNPTGATTGGSVAGTVRSGIQGSIRGRAGVAWDRLLIYGTGGVAFAGFNTDLQITGTDALGTFVASGSRSSTRIGWTAGGGVQYAITPHWSVGAEYRFSDFGHISDVQFPAVAGLSLTDNRHLAQNQVQVGVSYKFDSFAPAPVVAKY